ncbi:MAG: hypothetical protein HYR73_02140, partial [Candidatus Eisenbacteria bacterium]|nr:hypothetical protein [Candidatus Eisenbacteria bacterium]
NRPWWAIEVGNNANYVINERRDLTDAAAPGNRTYGVVGVWHVDPGNSVGLTTTSGTNPVAPAWAPLDGTKSAWMGLRGHGDVTVSDPITGNAFNDDVLQYNGFTGSNPTFGNGTSKHFPGYGNQMDQMLYRDIDVSTATTGVTIAFDYATAMSLGKDTAVKSRVGWFEGDPLSTAVGNLISAEAGPPTFAANVLAPVDSFQVYVGKPIDTSWTASNGLILSVYDPLRRWMNEVLDRDTHLWLYSAAGNHSKTLVVLTLTQGQVIALRSLDNRLRLVFRVHTNRGFDDENIVVSGSTSYNSGYMGAAQVDNVTYDFGGGPVTIGDFELPFQGDIDNNPGTSALTKWKSSGKPPAIYFHVHELADLTVRWNDLCGAPNNPASSCNMFGQVISMGNHDDNEATATSSVDTEHNGHWGMISPTVNFVTPGPTIANGWNLTGDEVTATEDYYENYEIYTGIFNAPATGCLWRFGFQAYPAKQSDGTRAWGEIRLPGFNYFDPDPQCFGSNFEACRANGCLATSNSSGIPDSMRIFMMKVQQCYRFGVSDVNCHITENLGLLDNMSLVIIDGVPQAMSVDTWQLITDTFPFNEDVSLPGTADFDSCAALIKNGLNTSQTTGNISRIDIPGDSTVVNADGQGYNIRVDMVFRIQPGPGNYVTPGNIASGLRHVPTSPAPATATDFWGSYKADPGDKSSLTVTGVNLHSTASGGWSPLMWNSARCDTARLEYFPVLGIGLDPTGGGAASTWMSTYHESEFDGGGGHASHVNLGVPRNRCFVVDTSLFTLVDPNVNCSGTPPAWVTTLPATRIGWDVTTVTTHSTKILPDGLFTPGTHVEYFFRREELTGPEVGRIGLVPDTTVVVPQLGEGSLDGHRWQEFSVLPDRWKEPAYGGDSKPCMLYIDWNDRRGDEMPVLGVMDSIGAIAAHARGINNGWWATGTTSPNSPANFVNKNGSAGTTFDKYDVKASESLFMSSNSIGSRHSNRTTIPPQIAYGKDAKNAPTDEMLSAYYRLLFLMSGDLNSSILGPFRDRSANDCKTLENFLLGATAFAWRGIYAGGDGFVEDAHAAGPGSSQLDFVSGYLGADLDVNAGATGYRTYSLNGGAMADLIPQPVLGAPPPLYPNTRGMRNSCFYTLDILQAVAGVRTPNAVVGVYYQNTGTLGPYAAAVANPGDIPGGHPWIDMVEGWNVRNITSRTDVNDYGRVNYYYQTFANLFGAIGCAVQGTPITLDTPNTNDGSQFVDFVGNFSNNPLRSGVALVRFGLAQSDRVEINVYDVSGRQVRKLADRMFPAGENTLTWDGVNDQGQIVPRGVYFTQVKFVNRHFSDSKKLTVLK